MNFGFDEPFGDKPVPIAEPGAGLSFAETLAHVPAAVAAEAGAVTGGRFGFSRVYEAARQQSQLLDLSTSSVIRAEQHYDGVIGAVEKASGVRLENPMRRGYEREAGYDVSPVGDVTMSLDRQISIFGEKLASLRASNPAVETAASEAETAFAPRAIVRRAQDELTGARAEASYTGSFLGQLAGGAVAGLRDPLNYIGLIFGAGGSAARTVAGRLASVAVTEAGVNAGIAAAQQPFIQAGREELGMPSGLGEAVENVAVAGLIGAAFGGATQGIREGVRGLTAKQAAAVDRALVPDASAGDIARALKETGFVLPQEEADVLRQAVRVERADDGVMKAVPPGIAPEVHQDAFAAAIARAEDPSRPPPEIVMPVRDGVTDDAALAVLERDDLHPMDALAMIRDDPNLIESALSSRSPAIREAGAVTLLPDDAFAMVRDEIVDPRHAALVVRSTADPGRQAAIMADLAELRPSNLREAREIVDAAVSAQTARARNAALMGGDLPPDAFAGAPSGIGRDGLFSRAAEADPAKAAAWRGRADTMASEYERWRGMPAGPERDAAGLRVMEAYGAALDAAGLPANRSSGSVNAPNDGSNVARQTGSAITPPVEATSGASTSVQSPPGSSLANAFQVERDSTAGLQSQLTKTMDPSDAVASRGQEAPALSSRKEDVRGMIPTMRDDGTTGFVARGQAALAGERDLFLTDVVRSCK